jgi:glutamine synthetase
LTECDHILECVYFVFSGISLDSIMKKREQLKGSERRGVGSAEQAGPWLEERGLEDIECIVPDMAGVARGKMMPVGKFVAAPKMALPGSIFLQTITGEYPDDDEGVAFDPLPDAGLFDLVGRAVGIGPDGAGDP